MTNLVYFDRLLLEYLRKNAQAGQISIVQRQIVEEFGCGTKTAYRALKRLKAAGHIQPIRGNNRTGYTYRIANAA